MFQKDLKRKKKKQSNKYSGEIVETRSFRNSKNEE